MIALHSEFVSDCQRLHTRSVLHMWSDIIDFINNNPCILWTNLRASSSSWVGNSSPLCFTPSNCWDSCHGTWGSLDLLRWPPPPPPLDPSLGFSFQPFRLYVYVFFHPWCSPAFLLWIAYVDCLRGHGCRRLAS